MAYKSKISQTDVRLYINKSTIFKLLLLIGIALISAIFVWYTFNVIDKLKVDMRSQVTKYVKMWQLAANSPSSDSKELQFIFDEIIVKATFPIVVLNQDHQPIHWRNIEGIEINDTTSQTLQYLKEVAEEMVEKHGEFPLYFGDEEADGAVFVNYFCYGDSDVINQLKMMPFVEIGILLAFLILAFIGFQNIRQSEERHIWVGMAKETAHQLGTPISSLMGWLEVIAADQEDNHNESAEVDKETVDNMKVDVSRLEKIANRFGLIGSVPELKPCDINKLIEDTVVYYRRRIPFEGKGVQINFESQTAAEVGINTELFGWVLENLIKNALQTVDSKKGNVLLRSSIDDLKKLAVIEIIDNGQGISPVASRKIFRAGFTTKKRGWGLGLTLVKRIVEEYHGGRIFLKKSKPGETIFEIQLPLHLNE